MHVSEKDLLEFLIDSGLASRKVLDAAREEAGKSATDFERIVLLRGILNDRDLRKAMSFILGVPFVGTPERGPG